VSVYNDPQYAPLPNSLPVVGQKLAERIIRERHLEEPKSWGGGRCWPAGSWPTQPRPTHKYVRALFGVVNSGGTLNAVVVCGVCGHGRESVSHQLLTRYDILPKELPLLADLRRDYCERCGELGAQLHHMAPWALFSDADNWPLAYLCQPCHALWHTTMGRP
jgi:hypothetical protein